MLTKVNKSLVQSLAKFSGVSHPILTYDRGLREYNDIPGPRQVPFLGSFFDLSFLPFGGGSDITDYRQFQIDLQERYGDIVKWKLLLGKEVFLFNPEHLRTIYQKETKIPARPLLEPMAMVQKEIGINHGLLVSGGERWANLRSATNPIIAKPQVAYENLPNQNRIINDFVAVMKKNVNNGGGDGNGTVQLKQFETSLRLLAYEYISQVAFDTRLNCMDLETCERSSYDFVNAVDEMVVYMGKLVFNLPFYKYYSTKDWKTFVQVSRTVYDEALRRVEEAAKLYEDMTPENEKVTLLSKLLDRRKKYNLNLLDVTAIMTDLLIGGVDTTSTTLYYLLYELGVNPNIQEKLYKEISRVLEPNEEITAEKLAKLKYLKYVVKENFRLHQIAPVNSRIIQEDIKIDNYLLPKGTQVNFGSNYIAQSERFFRNALKFDPERFERHDNGTEKIHPFSLLQFGHGARSCIGRRTAEQEIYLTLIKIVQNFKIEYTGKPPKILVGLILKPSEPLDLKVTLRK